MLALWLTNTSVPVQPSFYFYYFAHRTNSFNKYAAKFGNCHVPTKIRENSALALGLGLGLGRWVSTQRAEYKKFCNDKVINEQREDSTFGQYIFI